MTTLSGQLPATGHGTRVPVRVERRDGSLAVLTSAAVDGSWSVDVPAGEYVVRPRWLEPLEVSTAEQETTPTSQVGPGDLSRLMARRNGATWESDASDSTVPAPVEVSSWEPSERVRARRAEFAAGREG